MRAFAHLLVVLAIFVGFSSTFAQDSSGISMVAYTECPEGGYGLVIQDGYAYMSSWTAGMRIIDISDPYQPTVVGEFDTPDDGGRGMIHTLDVQGDYAYLFEGGEGMYIVDISDPTSPREVGLYRAWGWNRGGCVSGNYAYIGYEGWLLIVDISDPTRPTRVGGLEFRNYPGASWNVAVQGSYAYLALAQGGLIVADISDPSDPRVAKWIDTPDHTFSVLVQGDLCIIGGSTAYNQPEPGIRIYDISNPTDPQQLSYIAANSDASQMYLLDNILYASTDGALKLFDIQDPTDPKMIGWRDGGIHGLTGSDGLIFASYGGLEVFDCSDALWWAENDPTLINVPNDCETIQAAIYHATEDDTILVQPGTYYENLHFQGRNVSLIGDPEHPENIVIDGGNNGVRVIQFDSGETSDCLLTGFTIQNGIADDNHDNGGSGGGINCFRASPTLRNLIVRDNYAFNGGGLAFSESNSTLQNIVIADNRAEVTSGGINLSYASISLMNVTIAYNSANNSGGGVEVFNSNLTVLNGIITGNSPNQLDFYYLDDHGTMNVAYSVVQGGQQAIGNDGGNQSVAWGEGNISSDPLFLDPDNGNFNIHRGSPCLNAGDPDSPNDPDGTRADMGTFPYNYQGPITLNVPDEYATVQAGIDDAIVGDTVLVQPGTYYEHLRFLGRNITLGSLFLTTEEEHYIEETIIDGDGDRCLLIDSGEDSSAVVTGFTLQNGVAHYGEGGGNSGGGFRCLFASPTLRHLIVKNCQANYGGGMSIQASSPLLEDIILFGNTAVIGGGIEFTDAFAHLNRITFTANQAGDQYRGGAFDVYSSTPEWPTAIQITNSLIWGNEPAGHQVVFYPYSERASISMSYTDLQNGLDDVWYQSEALVLVRGEGNIDSDPYFADFDNSDFHLTRESPCIDSGDPESALDPDGTVADMGAYYAHQTFHRVPMRRGWNMLSSFNPARNPAIRAVWSEVVSRNNLILTKDQTGRFYSVPNNYSNMGPFDVRQGYQAKLADADTLVIVNVPMPVDTPIPLHQGWNMSAYFSEQDLTAQVAFANIVNHLEMVKDEGGRFYRPPIGFSNMGRLTRGKGYQIKVSQDVELIYNVEQRRMEEAALPNEVAPQHFAISSSDRNMSVLVSATITLQGELAAISTSGRCLGAVNVSGTPPYGLAIWGDDASTEVIDGAVEGEAWTFRLWDGAAEYTADMNFTEGNGNYTTDGFAQATITGLVSTPTEWSLSEPYPNPFNPSTTIKFALLEDSRVRLSVYDLAGREVATLVNSELKAGMHSATWNAEGFTSGIYLVKLESPSFSATKKVTLVR